jgi:hypothetical protein
MQMQTITISQKTQHMYLRSFLLLIVFVLAMDIVSTQARVVREAGKTFIVDQTGERWDVSQAQKLGFDAAGFQYGIGKFAFQTLDDRSLSGDTEGVNGNLRVIGVAGDEESQAYSIAKLRYHEVANTHIDAEPIAVGY